MKRILIALMIFYSIVGCARANDLFNNIEATQEERAEIERFITENEKKIGIVDIYLNEYDSYKLGRIIKVDYIDCEKYVSNLNLDESKCKDVYEADYYYLVEILKENDEFIQIMEIDRTPLGLKKMAGSLNMLFLFRNDCEETIKMLAVENGMGERIDIRAIELACNTWLWLTDGEKEFFVNNSRCDRLDPNSEDEEVWIPSEVYIPVLWDQSRFLENCKWFLDRYDSKWIVSDDEPVFGGSGGEQKAGSNTSRFIYVMSSIGIMMIIVPVVILLLKKKRDRTDICL